MRDLQKRAAAAAVPVITIDTQPASMTNVTVGSISGILSVAATAQGAKLSYQWYSNTANSSSGGTAISGATYESYTIPTSLTVGTYYYFCEVKASGKAASVWSNVARVNVTTTPVPAIAINIQPELMTRVIVGSISGSLTVAAIVTQGESLSYQWYSNTSASNSSGTIINGATNASFAISTTLVVGTYFYFCEVRATGGAASVRSRAATVNVITPPIISTSGIELLFVPGGSFEMGRGLSGSTDVTPVSTVTLSNFSMAKYQVTQEQYQTVMGSNPSGFSSNPAEGETQDRRPVEQVSWHEAIVFCNILSTMDGLSPAYRISGSTDPAVWGSVPEYEGDPLRDIWDAVEIVNGSTGYRLPTEAQWEYAAKGGNGSPGSYTYAGGHDIDPVAWFYNNSSDMTHEVGKKAPNGLGLYDMSGNVQEWCWDRIGDYTSEAKTDPQGALSGGNRITRGGCYYNTQLLLSVYRADHGSILRARYIGFRVVCPDTSAAAPVITINTQPAATTNVTAGSISASLSVSAGVTLGATLSYQWYSNTTNSSSGGTAVSGATNASYAIPTTLAAGAYYYFCEVRATGGTASVRSNVATVNVAAPSIISTSGIELIVIPAGTFIMGSSDSEDFEASPPHQVTLSKGFSMGKYEVTQEQYQTVTGTNPSDFSGSPASGETQVKRPVEYVTWFDAVEFCNKLSALEGFAPAYTITDRSPSSGYPISSATVTANWEANGYRLPTEAEWEYACRAGTTTAWSFGSTESQATDYAWYSSNSNSMTHEVGKKQPNAWGLHDMHGNVNEWCWDWYGTYASGAQTDPRGAVSGTNRVLRGGGWYVAAQVLRSAFRNKGGPGDKHVHIGFRVVRPDTSAAAPVITINTQPAATTNATAGNISGSLSVSAGVTLGATISYQWYSNTSASNSGGTVLSGATNASYTIPTTLAAGTHYYFCEVRATGGAASVRSNVATVTVQPPPFPVEMVLIPAGTFTRGSSDSEDYNASPPHPVTLSRGFYMGKYTVTQAQYQAVMGTNPSEFSSNPASGETQSRRPVEMVTWYAAVEFCNKLSQMEGLVPVYTITDRYPESGYPITYATVTANWETNGYRLPTDAEWEYACRAGTTTAWSFGSTDSQATDYAWYSSNSNGMTHEVGKKQPNAWGLHDMHGNVTEWCWDWFGDYSSEVQTDPRGAVSGDNRVRRGGCWYYDARNHRSAIRERLQPYNTGNNVGFRLVRPSPSPVITINTQPAATTNVIAGNISGSLTIWASVTGGAALSYQWYSNTSSSISGGTAIGGATYAIYTIPTTLTVGTYYYFCEVRATGGAAPVRSSAATVNVAAPEITSSSGIELLWIPAGTFTMGSSDSVDLAASPPHQVTLSRGFYMGKYEVTQAQYQAVTGTNPSYFSGSPASGETQGRRPVENVTWYDAAEFCNKLSALEGLAAAYTITDRSPSSGYPIESASVTANWDANGYRLPTEAEWEYACRAGTTTAWSFGSTESQLADYAWYSSNSNDMTHEVGKKQPNAWGLYDMHGNVWEWCWDWYDGYTSGAQTDPRGAESGTHRVRRCSGWNDNALSLRSAFRGYGNPPDDRGRSFGFRLVRP